LYRFRIKNTPPSTSDAYREITHTVLQKMPRMVKDFYQKNKR